MKKVSVILIAVLAMSMLLTACGSKNTTLTVDMNEYNFIPSTFEVKAGGEVTINLSNSGTLQHEFVIMKLGTEASIPFDENDEGNVLWETEMGPGQSGTVTFTAPSEPGTYQVVCGTPAHLEQGMLGTLTVK